MQSVRNRTSARRRGQSRTSIFRAGNGVRIDSAVYRGYTVPPWYDSMLAKLIVWGKDREEAIQRMRSALGEIIIEGIETNVDYQYGILQDPDYCSGKFDVEFVPESGELLLPLHRADEAISSKADCEYPPGHDRGETA